MEINPLPPPNPHHRLGNVSSTSRARNGGSARWWWICCCHGRFSSITLSGKRYIYFLPNSVFSNLYVWINQFFQLNRTQNSLRKAFFDEEKSQNLTDAEGHIDHCFSYLLQTLLCHADVGSMTTRWDELEGVYQANFNVTRTCRSYDAVREWAEGRKIWRILFMFPVTWRYFLYKNLKGRIKEWGLKSLVAYQLALEID